MQHILKIKVMSKTTGKFFPAVIRIFAVRPGSREKSNAAIREIFSPGTSVTALENGIYLVEVSHFSEIVPVKQIIEIPHDDTVEFIVETWFEFRKHGLFAGDCHNHVNYPEKTEKFRNFLRATGIDYISACQGWMTSSASSRGHDGKKLSAFLEAVSTDDLTVRMGAEFPKTRFGHICWWKFPLIADPYGCYEDYHDINYFKIAGSSTEECGNPAKQLPFLTEPPVFKLKRWKDQGGICMLPHPTSWWRNNDKAALIATNIGADICFDLLAGRLYDTMAVMGYNPEQIFYQNLWFRLLNLGYQIPGVAETDGGIGPGHQIGSLRTYAYCNEENFNEKSFLAAISSGQSFMTSGPVILAKADRKYLPGSVIQHRGGRHTIRIDAVSSPVDTEYISWIIVYKNGRPFKTIDIEKKKLRQYRCDIEFNLNSGSSCWFIVKVYGRKRPAKKACTDIFKYAASCENEVHTEYQELDQVAFTNPFYFIPPGSSEPPLLTPSLRGRITDAVTGKPIANAAVNVLQVNGTGTAVKTGKSGVYSFNQIPLIVEIEISADGYQTEQLSIYNDYPPLKKYFESIYAGKWANANRILQPGQTPWQVFNFPQIKRILSALKWDMQLSPERS